MGGVSDEFADPKDLLFGEVLHLPVRTSFADLQGEVGEDVSASGGMRDLGVELDACSNYASASNRINGNGIEKGGATKDRLRLVGYAGELGILRASDGDKILRKTNELVEVAHKN